MQEHLSLYWIFLLQDTEFSSILNTYLHIFIKISFFPITKISIHNLGNIGFSPIIHISKWSLIFIFFFMVTWPVVIFRWTSFSVNTKKYMMLEEWANSSFILNIWCVVWGPICHTLFKCHSDDWIITFHMGIPYGVNYYQSIS